MEILLVWPNRYEANRISKVATLVAPLVFFQKSESNTSYNALIPDENTYCTKNINWQEVNKFYLVLDVLITTIVLFIFLEVILAVSKRFTYGYYILLLILLYAYDMLAINYFGYLALFTLFAFVIAYSINLRKKKTSLGVHLLSNHRLARGVIALLCSIGLSVAIFKVGIPIYFGNELNGPGELGIGLVGIMVIPALVLLLYYPVYKLLLIILG